MQTAWTNIRPILIRRFLFIGIFIVSFGILLIFLAKIFLPPHLLLYLGLPITLIGATLIVLGLRPYRKLIKLDKNPNKILFDDDGLQFFVQDELLLSIPFDSIKKIEYLDYPTIYGIGIWLKHGVTEENPLTKKMHRSSQRSYGCDYFLPYFSRNVCDVLISQSLQYSTKDRIE